MTSMAPSSEYYFQLVNTIQLLYFIEWDMMCYGALKSNIQTDVISAKQSYIDVKLCCVT